MATPSELNALAACDFQCIPAGMQRAVMIYLLQQWNGSDYTVDELLAKASCYQQCIPTGMQGSVIIYLLNVITDGGGDSNLIATGDGNFLWEPGNAMAWS